MVNHICEPISSNQFASCSSARVGQGGGGAPLTLDHVAGFMNLAALDRRVGAKGATDNFAQRLGAVDDEQPADLGIKPALDQVVDERLHDGGVLGCSFD